MNKVAEQIINKFKNQKEEEAGEIFVELKAKM